MSHLSEEQLVWHYYGEAEDAAGADEHLARCPECRQAYAALQRVLNLVDGAPAPGLGESYGREVWERLRPALPKRRRWLPLEFPRGWAVVVATAALVALAFVAGRYSHRQEPIAQGGPPSQQVRDRVLLVAVGDHLERSQMVLAELVNTRPRAVVDISPERQIASDLVGENRLYRQTAAFSGETALASLLEELEPLLLEIARGPSRLTAIELERFRRRVESEGMLFKIRVVGSNVREREKDKEL
ncbi:MAG: hypothetical protein ABSH05_18240 [Bryobacteraceae bacterium]|jgi:hypothetical protein